MAFRNVYTFGPTFRAEKSYTQRHAAEFWMIEPEIAFADLADDMELAEAMIKYVVILVLLHHLTVFTLAAWSWHHMVFVLIETVVSSFITEAGGTTWSAR